MGANKGWKYIDEIEVTVILWVIYDYPTAGHEFDIPGLNQKLINKTMFFIFFYLFIYLFIYFFF